jgi:hypothetical protein
VRPPQLPSRAANDDGAENFAYLLFIKISETTSMINVQEGGAPAEANDWNRPAGLTWHGYLVQLLHIASSIEHALLVQYLYAAYSLSSENISQPDDLNKLNVWRNLILSIAKEEMGHLLTVQNVLCLLGGQMELVRENYPWDSNFYPFEFHLERLTMGSLALYIYAEMGDEPHHDTYLDGLFVELAEKHLIERAEQAERQQLGDRANKIRKSLIELRTPGVHRVGVLYGHIIEILNDPNRIPDSHFYNSSVLYQTSTAEWSRGYWAESPVELMTDVREFTNRVRDTLANAATRKKIAAHAADANIMIDTVATRQQAVAALKRIAAQGEGELFHLESHFLRFSAIMTDFLEFRQRNPQWEPWTHRVATDPHVRWSHERQTGSTITHPLSEKWANLFNLRYRMLLTYLSHSFQLSRDDGQARLRGAVVHKVFAEMYNLKAIAGILVRLPLTDQKNDKRRAGPPFQMPYTLAISMDPMERWRLHQDLIEGARELGCDLQKRSKPPAADFLQMMRELDNTSDQWLKQVITGLTRDGGPPQ